MEMIRLKPEVATLLEERAQALAVSLEELANTILAESLSVPTDEEFERSADRVLSRYEDLYRRLA